VSRAVLALGSNLGDREAHLRGALAGLGETVRATSGVYETPPWGDPDQPSYLNAVVIVVDRSVGPRDWLDRAHRLERQAGRERDPARRYGPRTLDVDVIAVWDDDGAALTVDEPDLVVPHPLAHRRAFVLRPWLDIEPYGQLPGHGRLSDLVRVEPVAGDLPDVRACPDIRLDTV
jgi:2-amino-4-hydroxy-6-hydroxymethyldihydropteridine diphosphokinase